VLVARRQHSPHQELLLLGSLITGIAYTVGVPPPESIAALLPSWQVHVWAAAMLLSGLAGLMGCYWQRDFVTARKLESGAMELGAGAMIVYSGCLFVYAGERAMGAGVVFGLWAAANMWRSFQIHQELKEMTRK
jgi:hypothetical protein